MKEGPFAKCSCYSLDVGESWTPGRSTLLPAAARQPVDMSGLAATVSADGHTVQSPGVGDWRFGTGRDKKDCHQSPGRGLGRPLDDVDLFLLIPDYFPCPR